VRSSSALYLAVLLFAGCATAPPPRPVVDLKLIVGTWRGSNDAGSPVDLIVYANGSFEAIITTPQQTLHRSGQIRMEGPQLVYDADSSYGRIAYFESDGKRRLIMSGTLKQGGQQFVIEYLPSNR
jgi:hypothetical protein